MSISEVKGHENGLSSPSRTVCNCSVEELQPSSYMGVQGVKLEILEVLKCGLVGRRRVDVSLDWALCLTWGVRRGRHVARWAPTVEPECGREGVRGPSGSDVRDFQVLGSGDYVTSGTLWSGDV